VSGAITLNLSIEQSADVLLEAARLSRILKCRGVDKVVTNKLHHKKVLLYRVTHNHRSVRVKNAKNKLLNLGKSWGTYQSVRLNAMQPHFPFEISRSAFLVNLADECIKDNFAMVVDNGYLTRSLQVRLSVGIVLAVEAYN